MTLLKKRSFVRTLFALVVAIQGIAFSFVAAAHAPARSANVVVVSQAGGSTQPAHDELLCPLCSYAAQQGEPVPSCEIVICLAAPDAPVSSVSIVRTELPPHFIPSWRAPPVILS